MGQPYPISTCANKSKLMVVLPWATPLLVTRFSPQWTTRFLKSLGPKLLLLWIAVDLSSLQPPRQMYLSNNPSHALSVQCRQLKLFSYWERLTSCRPEASSTLWKLLRKTCHQASKVLLCTNVLNRRNLKQSGKLKLVNWRWSSSRLQPFNSLSSPSSRSIRRQVKVIEVRACLGTLIRTSLTTMGQLRPNKRHQGWKKFRQKFVLKKWYKILTRMKINSSARMARNLWRLSSAVSTFWTS